MKNFCYLVGLWAAMAVTGWTQEPAPAADEAQRSEAMAKIQKLVSALDFQSGKVVLRNGLATINVPEGFRFLSGKDAGIVLHKLWGNPPRDTPPLGLLVPFKGGPPEASLAGEDSWAVVVEFEEDGHVKDADAGSIDYTSLLKDMQAGVKDASAERVKQGYEPIALIGWAAPPRYDAETKKLYWAKELQFGANPEHTLNYNIRMLGRRGVLVLNAVAGMGQIDEIEAATPSILSMVEFQDGHRYSDFQSGDKVATYGLAALVAGGVLGKAGFFKVLLVGLLAAKKFVIIGALALVTFLRKFFGKNDQA